MNNLKKALQCLNLQKLVNFFDSNACILHKSRYHHEGFDIHCYLVIGNMIAEFEAGRVSEEAVMAACLHDIAKPRTAALNKRGEACFYGHEKVTDEELAEFLDPSYQGFSMVADLVRGHMLPYGASENTPEPWRGRNQEALRKLLLKYKGSTFAQYLEVLHLCDDKSCVRNDADLPVAEKEAEAIKSLLLQIAQ